MPFCIPTKNELGEDFKPWDGSTLDPALNPSGSATARVTVYGSGSLYCLKLNAFQLTELYWRAVGFKTEVEVKGGSFVQSASASTRGTYYDYYYGDPKGYVVCTDTYASVSGLSSSFSPMYNVYGVCQAWFDREPGDPSQGQFCDWAKLYKGSRLLSDSYLYLKTYPNVNPTEYIPWDEQHLVCNPHPSPILCDIGSTTEKPADGFASFTPYSYKYDNGERNTCVATGSVMGGAGGNYGWPGGFEEDSPVISVAPYVPDFSPYAGLIPVIQTGSDEFWLNPQLVVSINVQASVGTFSYGLYSADGDNVKAEAGPESVDATAAVTGGTSSTYWGQYYGQTPSKITDIVGGTIKRIPITFKFSDGSTVSGDRFILMAIFGSSSYYEYGTWNPQTYEGAGSSFSAAGAYSTAQVSVNPDIAIPQKITVSTVKFLGYDSGNGPLYNTETGAQIK